jgi:hypothetical protein
MFDSVDEHAFCTVVGRQTDGKPKRSQESHDTIAMCKLLKLREPAYDLGGLENENLPDAL